jgi:hypothetical protein
MNYSIFEIESQINNITKNHNEAEILDIYNGKPSVQYLISADLLMQEIISKKNICKELFKLQEEKRSQFTRAFADAALILEYLTETESYLKQIRSEIIDNEEKDNTLFILDKLVVYFLTVFKEIYVLSLNDCFLGATGRYRIFLEIYCIFKYFAKYPNAISRFVDHFLIKDHLQKKRFTPNSITPEDIKAFDILRNRYKDEYKRSFKKNYGWASQKLKRPDSIKEIMELALNEQELTYVNTEYNLVSEYSHASLNMAMRKNIDIDQVYNFLGKSGELSIVIMRIYIGWIINITKIQDKRLLALSDLLGRLINNLYNDYHRS